MAGQQRAGAGGGIAGLLSPGGSGKGGGGSDVGTEHALWILVALEVGALWYIRKSFGKSHGG